LTNKEHNLTTRITNVQAHLGGSHATVAIYVEVEGQDHINGGLPICVGFDLPSVTTEKQLDVRSDIEQQFASTCGQPLAC
jgi:hypothetical protein